jgi:hypothetical protein
MTHLDDDTLLRSALETLDERDNALARAHLAVCLQCKERMERVREEVGRLSGISVEVGEVAAPSLRRRWVAVPALARAAAILAFGFLAGYVTADLTAPLRPAAVQQRLVPGGPPAPRTGFFPCQAVDVGPGGTAALH